MGVWGGCWGGGSTVLAHLGSHLWRNGRTPCRSIKFTHREKGGGGTNDVIADP